MTELLEQKPIGLSSFTRAASAGRNGLPWLERLRDRGIARFETMGFPTTRDEEWRFTTVNPIARTQFALAGPDNERAAELVAEYSFGNSARVELVFVNGIYAPQLSRLGASLPGGVFAGSLAEALHTKGALLERHMGRYASIEANPFVALNAGYIRDGACIHVPRGASMDGPIHLLFIATASDEPTMSHPRTLIVIDENAEATVVESHVGGGAGTYFTNAVTELVVGADARVDHCKLQQEALSAYYVSTTQVQMHRASNFVSHSASLGAKLSRNDVNVIMGGEGADATVNGLVVIGGNQHCDNHTILLHEKPNCPSHELYKHVLDEKAMGVFKGKIFVQKDAQKTDSKQTSKSLLLSDTATMQSMPALEIYADDVKCTHGSTIGPVDEEMVFYLRSRGVSMESARRLLTYAFAADITRRIRVEPVRRRLEDYMAAQHGLPQDLRITDLGRHDEAAL